MNARDLQTNDDDDDDLDSLSKVHVSQIESEFTHAPHLPHFIHAVSFQSSLLVVSFLDIIKKRDFWAANSGFPEWKVY